MNRFEGKWYDMHLKDYSGHCRKMFPAFMCLFHFWRTPSAVYNKIKNKKCRDKVKLEILVTISQRPKWYCEIVYFVLKTVQNPKKSSKSSHYQARTSICSSFPLKDTSYLISQIAVDGLIGLLWVLGCRCWNPLQYIQYILLWWSLGSLSKQKHSSKM